MPQRNTVESDLYDSLENHGLEHHTHELMDVLDDFVDWEPEAEHRLWIDTNMHRDMKKDDQE